MATPQVLGSVEPGQLRYMPQSSNSVGIVPYAQVGNEWTLPDAVVLGFAMRSVADGTFQTVFRDSEITDPRSFLDAMKKPANVPVFFFVGTEIIGVAWLNGQAGNRAFAHFLFLRKAWGKHTDEAERVGLDYWFSFRVGDERLFDVILGIIPAGNVRAINFVGRIGFTVLGCIPKMFRFDDVPQAGCVVYLAR